MLSKSGNRSKSEHSTPAATGGRGSLSFLHKLNPHNKTSPTQPENTFVVQVEPTEVRDVPVDPLQLTPEFKSGDINETQCSPDEVWFESSTDPSKTAQFRPGSISPVSPSPMERRANEREAVQISLEEHLEDFRGGRMRSLTDAQVNKLRAMHEGQLRLTALHQQLTEFDDPLR
uniref:Testis expressed 2 n=2 Tax=Bursaphelenchus xylophilus TaxID=6326 RepID=A0A1I7SJW6_BURXY